MMKNGRIFTLLAILSLSLPAAGRGQEKPSAEDIVARASQVSHYTGSDMKARVLMRLINKEGKERTREMTMLRWNQEDGRSQKYFLYFHQPGDVRDMTFMIWKHPQRDDER